jgi:hypothetical protein
VAAGKLIMRGRKKKNILYGKVAWKREKKYTSENTCYMETSYSTSSQVLEISGRL